MKILDAKNGLLKFETEQECLISSFCEIKDSHKNYIANNTMQI